MKSHFHRQYLPLVIIGLVILDFLLLLIIKGGGEKIQPAENNSYPESSFLENKNLTFKELSDYFTEVAETKGAEYAYQILRTAPLPPNTDLHLLGHVVGDVLYKQRGAEGIRICTNEFRNACSHSIVVGLFFDKGDSALEEIAEICRKAPGGSGAYTMCFHGLGHGILAHTGYDMAKAAEFCNKTGTEKYYQREMVECIGGTVMEIIGGGFHDPKLWAIQARKYLSSKDPLALCKNSFIPKLAEPQCYNYLTPHLFKLAGANLQKPNTQNIARAFIFCDQITAEEVGNLSACYSGFGKEFVVLAQDRDIRKINQATDEQLETVYEWCLLADNREGVQSCINSAANSLYWGGENDKSVAIRFCKTISDPIYQESCFKDLIGAAFFYKREVGYLNAFCNELPANYQTGCKNKIAN